jgi:hypothetical protein
MSESEKLIPVFVPPLAKMLAFAEREKKSPLTQQEVEAVRDKSACIMMPQAEAARMPEARGFIDVNPDNCWADWHRLRVQMVGGYLPKLVLGIPGDDDFRRASETILQAEDVEYQFRGHDPNLLRAFRASSMAWPSFSEEEFARIDRHETVLYILSKNFTAAEAPAISHAFLNLTKRLLDAGGIAAKCESSGISHSRERWLKHAEVAALDDYHRWTALYVAYVQRPISGNGDLYSCGMHLLGAPDMIVSESILKPNREAGQSTIGAAAQLFQVFAVYFLGECPVGKFASGHTFSIERDAPRYRVIWEPCTTYAKDDLFFNPFGRWRFTAVN